MGCAFAADVMKRYGHLILQEMVSSYTLCSFIDSECHELLRDGLLVLCAEIRSCGDYANMVVMKNETI